MSPSCIHLLHANDILLSSSQGYKEVFELIHERKLYSALLENLVPLLEVGTEVSKDYYYRNENLRMYSTD